MKNSIDKYSQEPEDQSSCSEETCAICFQNRGGIYEQLVSQVIAVTRQSLVFDKENSHIQGQGRSDIQNVVPGS